MAPKNRPYLSFCEHVQKVLDARLMCAHTNIEHVQNTVLPNDSRPPATAGHTRVDLRAQSLCASHSPWTPQRGRSLRVPVRLAGRNPRLLSLAPAGPNHRARAIPGGLGANGLGSGIDRPTRRLHPSHSGSAAGALGRGGTAPHDPSWYLRPASVALALGRLRRATPVR